MVSNTNNSQENLVKEASKLKIDPFTARKNSIKQQKSFVNFNMRDNMVAAPGVRYSEFEKSGKDYTSVLISAGEPVSDYGGSVSRMTK